MLKEFSELPAGHLVLLLLALVVVCAALVVIARLGLPEWRKVRQIEADTALKTNLLERGFPPEAIEKVVRPDPPAEKVVADAPAGSRAARIIWAIFGSLALFMAVIMVGAGVQSYIFWSNVHRPPSGAAPAPDRAPAGDDLDRLQGKWEYSQKDAAGKTCRTFQEIKGNRATLTVHGAGGNVVYSHVVDFQVERTSLVRLFSFSNLKVVVPPAEKNIPFLELPKGRSFLYRLDGDMFTEAEGFLVGDTFRPVSLLTWTRVKE